MAKYSKKNGGGLSGTIGPISVYKNKMGLEVMRSLPTKKTAKPPTFEQLKSWAHLSTASTFEQMIREVIIVGYKNFTKGICPGNQAVSQIKLGAVAGEYPNYYVDTSKVLVSFGPLPNAAVPAVAAINNEVVFTWEDNTGLGIAKSNDNAILALVCTELKSCVFTDSTATRKELTGAIDASLFKGHVVDTYIGFISKNGKYVANSIYTGQVTVAA